MGTGVASQKRPPERSVAGRAGDLTTLGHPGGCDKRAIACARPLPVVHKAPSAVDLESEEDSINAAKRSSVSTG